VPVLYQAASLCVQSWREQGDMMTLTRVCLLAGHWIGALVGYPQTILCVAPLFGWRSIKARHTHQNTKIWNVTTEIALEGGTLHQE
jgi:hypothetical protein